MFLLLGKFFKWVWEKVNKGAKRLVSALRLRRIRNALSHTFHLDQQLVLTLHERKIPSVRQLKYLPKVLSRLEKRLLAVLFLFWFAATGFLGSRFYFAHRIFVPDFGGEYTEALVGSPKFINPLFSSGNNVDADISRLIYSGLLAYDGQGNLVPDLAESYEISEDFKTYTLTLRADAKWHDNTPITSDDLLFTITSIQDTAIKSPLAVSFAGVVAEKVDGRTIKLALKDPFAPFLTALTVGILPKHIWAGITPAQIRLTDLNIKPIGSGPFRFKSFVRGRDGGFRSYTMERNELFYRQKPYLDKIIFRFYPDYASAEEALRNKTVLGLQYLAIGGASAENAPASAGLTAGIDKNPEIEYYKLKLPQYTALFFNVKSSDVLADQTVRKALSLGLDKERILREAIKTEGTVISSPILEGFLGFNSNIKPLPYEPDSGIALLENSGWKLSATGTTRAKKSKNLAFKFVTVESSEHISASKVIAENWRALGAEVTVEHVPAASIQHDIIRPRNYDVLLYGEILGIEPDPYPFWHSSQVEDPGFNLSGFINRDADQLLEEARVLSRAEDRATKYRAFQEILFEEIPAIFLYSPHYIYPLRKTVKGFDLKLLSAPADRFANVEEWYLKTKRAFR